MTQPEDPELQPAMRTGAAIASQIAQSALSPTAQCTALAYAISSIMAGHPGPQEEFDNFVNLTATAIRALTSDMREDEAEARKSRTQPRSDEEPSAFFSSMDGPPRPGMDIRYFELDTGAMPWPASHEEMTRLGGNLPLIGTVLAKERPEMVVMSAAIALAVLYKTNSHRFEGDPKALVRWVEGMISNALAAPISRPQGIH